MNKLKIERNLVSIITPCFNGESFVKRYLDSIVNQSYKSIELIFINDGSTDSTEDIFMKYEKIFEENKIRYIYVYQENAGQAAALNRALKLIHGEFLMWPDSDDVLEKTNVEEKVHFLRKHDDCGMVQCWVQCVYQNDGQYGSILKREVINSKDDFFEDLIKEHNVYFPPGGYMVRTAAVIDVIPDLDIFVSRAGQNWQLLLPLAAKYKCGYIDKVLFYYYIRNESHSRQEKSYYDIIMKYNAHEEILVNTLARCATSDKYHFTKMIKEKYAKRKFYLAFDNQDKEMIDTEYQKLKEYGCLNTSISIKHMISKNKFFMILYSVLKRKENVGKPHK